MTQSDAIFGALTIAFIIYVTSKGELPIYLGFLMKNAASAPASASSSGVGVVKSISQAQQSLVGDLPPNDVAGP